MSPAHGNRTWRRLLVRQIAHCVFLVASSHIGFSMRVPPPGLLGGCGLRTREISFSADVRPAVAPPSRSPSPCLFLSLSPFWLPLQFILEWPPANAANLARSKVPSGRGGRPPLSSFSIMLLILVSLFLGGAALREATTGAAGLFRGVGVWNSNCQYQQPCMGHGARAQHSSQGSVDCSC